MSIVTAPPPLAPSVPAPTPARPRTYGLDPSTYRFSVRQYEQMIDAGILGPDDKIELLDGYLVLKMPTNPPHDGTSDLVEHTLRSYVPAGWLVRGQKTLKLPTSNPEPDAAVVRGGPRSYQSRHPEPADTALVIEVANTSLTRDLHDKALVYAEAGVPAYWVVDVVNRVVECFARPAATGYADRKSVRPPDTLTLTLDGTAVTLPAAELLPSLP